jgi:microcystin-dependent protein
MSSICDLSGALAHLGGRGSVVPALFTFVNNMSLHVGEYKLTAASTDMSGWLLCDGRSLSRTAYDQLFAVIGTAFGSADSTTFNLPDFRGRAIGLAGHGAGLTNRSIGETVGEETHVLSATEMPSHTHAGTTDADGNHTHSTNAVGGSVGLAVADGTNTVIATDPSAGELNVWTTPRSLTVDYAGTHTHTFVTGATGGGAAHNNMQPTLFAGNVLIFSGLNL